MGYYANGYGMLEVKDDKAAEARLKELLKDGVYFDGDIELIGRYPASSLIEFCYYDQKYHEEDVLEALNALAPLVVEGSMMEFRGEDDEHWAFVLENGAWAEKQGHIVYE